MPKHPTSILILSMSLAILSAAPAIAADGQIVITQAKANAGNVTPGDTPGFPVTLSLPGSYIFASNLRPPADKAGIQITSDRVTVDLNGFQLNGAAGATSGIRADSIKGTTIRNGTVTGFAGDGIYGQDKNWIVEDMRVVENGGGRHHGWGLFLRARQHGRGEWRHQNPLLCTLPRRRQHLFRERQSRYCNPDRHCPGQRDNRQR